MRGDPLRVPVPGHVPPGLVVEFDAYDPPDVSRDCHQAWRSLQDHDVHELVWTPFNGGHWMPTSGRLVAAMFADYEKFSNRILLAPKDPVGEASSRCRPRSIRPSTRRIAC